MSKIKMKYKEVATRVKDFMFKDVSKDRNGQAFQKFVEYMVLPGGTKEYTDELIELYILETMIKTDILKQKQAKKTKKVITELDKRTKKFINQKECEKFWNKIKNILGIK